MLKFLNPFIEPYAKFYVLYCGILLIVFAKHHPCFSPTFSDVIALSGNSTPSHRLSPPKLPEIK